MFPITEPFVTAETEYHRERAMAGRNRRGLVPVQPRRERRHRAFSFVHRGATGH